MSDVQGYLLEADNDRTGAERIARGTAHSRAHISPLARESKLTRSQSSKTKKFR